ncbi:MAG: DUF1080 domain-containing protein [Fuerstiella sp.]
MNQLTTCLSSLLMCLIVETAMAQQFTNLLSNQMGHWQQLNGQPTAEGWQIEDGGVLHLTGKAGNIVTRERYGDFELWFEFKVADSGNSGIKYRVRQYGKSWLGLEYQILDDERYPHLTRDHLTASLYDLVTPIADETRLNSRDEFNVGKIRVQNGRVQHWVNGQLMIDTRLSGPGWKEHVRNSKFKDRPNFGENRLGRIMLTDHNSEAWYRNVFIRRLDSCSCP